jgi:hypothetical protein
VPLSLAVVGGDLTDAALEGGYSAATVVELCRFFYDQPRLAELTDAQSALMAGRLRLARVRASLTTSCAASRRRALRWTTCRGRAAPPMSG